MQVAAADYQPQWMDELKADLGSLSGDYHALLAPHAAAWGVRFNRVGVDLNGTQQRRA